MARFNNITETIGRTPAVKMEAFNPLGSVKGHLALGIIFEIVAADMNGEEIAILKSTPSGAPA